MWWAGSVPRMYSAAGVRSALTIPKLVRNSSAASRSGARSRPYARSVTLMMAIALSFVAVRCRAVLRVGLRPDLFRKREPLEVGFGQRRVRLHLHALEKPVDLAQVLGGVPRGALHEVVGRLRAVVRADGAVAPARLRAVRGDPPAHCLAVAGDGIAVRHLGRRLLVES